MNLFSDDHGFSSYESKIGRSGLHPGRSDDSDYKKNRIALAKSRKLPSLQFLNMNPVIRD